MLSKYLHFIINFLFGCKRVLLCNNSYAIHEIAKTIFAHIIFNDEKINLIVCIVLAGLLKPAFAQQVVPLTQNKLIETIKEQKIFLKISEQNYAKAKANFKETNAIFLPSVTASHTGIVTTNPLAAFGSKLNQEILTQSDFNPALLNNPSQTQNFATLIEVKQPLFNMDGMYQRKALKIQKEATYLQTQRGKEHVVLGAKNRIWICNWLIKVLLF